MDFNSLYRSTSNETKLQFLDALLNQNEELQKQFVKYAETPEGAGQHLSFPEFCEEVEDTRILYLDFFGEIDTENPDLDHHVASHSGYMEEWEVYQEASEQEVREIFEHFRNKALDTIISQEPDKLLAMLAGLFLAVEQADIEDPVESFDDFNQHLMWEFDAMMNTVIEKVKMAPLGNSVISSAFSLFFSYCDREYPGNKGFVRNFERLLAGISEKSNSPGELLSILDQSSMKLEDMPVLTLLLMKKSRNEEGWLQMAQKTYRDDVEVARQLLKYYYENDPDHFRKTGRELFDRDQRSWAPFLQDYVTPETDRSLYVDVFFQLTFDQDNIDHYRKIRGFLSDAEKNDLIEKMSWRRTFVVQILEIEERYEEIKQMVESNWVEYEFSNMIRPILNIYPEFCFNEITRRVREALETRRGRGTYRTIAEWLKLSQEIPGFFNEKREIINELYHHKPNLPALKDELRRAGLMNLNSY